MGEMKVKRRVRQEGRRSGVLAVRVSPEARYQAELLAQLHQRSVSEVVEIALARLAAQPESRGGAVLVRQVESWDRNAAMGSDKEIDLVQETWDDEDWARRLKLAALHPQALPPEERVFWKEVFGDRENFEDSAVPDDIDFEEDEPVASERLVFGAAPLNLPVLKRDVVRAKWERFAAAKARSGSHVNR